MKTNLLLISGAFLALTTLVAGTLYPDGSPGAKTGSPLDGASCIECHSGTETFEVIWLSSNIPETGWTPGETYSISANAIDTSAVKIGFELTAENESEKVGVFTISDSERTMLVNQNKAVTHTIDGNASTDGENSWDVTWTAPNDNMGDITFYAAFNAANGNGNTSGDVIYTSAIVYSQDNTTTDVSEINKISLKIFPNPATNFVFVQSPSNILEVKLIDLKGSRIKTFSNVNSKQSQLDIRDLNKGIYIARVKTVKGEVDRKIQLK